MWGLDEILVCIGVVSWEGGEGREGRRQEVLFSGRDSVVVREEKVAGVCQVKRQSRVCTACWMLGVSMEVPNLGFITSRHFHRSSGRSSVV